VSEVEAGGWAGVRCTSRNGRDWVDGCGSVPKLGFRNVMPGPAGAFSASGAVHFSTMATSTIPPLRCHGVQHLLELRISPGLLLLVYNC
jgi:hypothetical protein